MYSELKFIGDVNVGKLVRWLRTMGYDTAFFKGNDDSEIVRAALEEGRVILTRDTGLVERHLITSGRVRAVLLKSEKPQEQMKELSGKLKISSSLNPFTRCIECNLPLVARSKEEVEGKVPPYVLKTQEVFNECPHCHRVYWRGTHWRAMQKRLERLVGSNVQGS